MPKRINLQDLEITAHGSQRLSQRNLSRQDIEFTLKYGRIEHCAGATVYFLGYRDIPNEYRNLKRFNRLQGTVLIISKKEPILITAYRNRKGLRKLKKRVDITSRAPNIVH